MAFHRLKLETEQEAQRQGATMNLLREYQVNMAKLRSNMDELDKVTKRGIHAEENFNM
jgi:hypothetical protein